MKNSRLSRVVITLGTLFFIFPFVAAIITPPDVISQIFVIIEMAIIYGLLTLLISRFKSIKQTSEDIKILIVILVGLLSITIPCSITLFWCIN